MKEQIENEIDKLEKKFRENNIKRLNEKSCSATSSVIFLDLISNLERIGLIVSVSLFSTEFESFFFIHLICGILKRLFF